MNYPTTVVNGIDFRDLDFCKADNDPVTDSFMAAKASANYRKRSPATLKGPY